MTTNWQGQVKGIMYSEGITNLDIAEKLNLSPYYISKLFTGKYTAKDGEERIRWAVNEIIRERKGDVE